MTANCHKFASVFQWLNLDQWDVGRSSVYATSRPSPKNTAIWSGFLFFPPCRLEPGESKEGNGTPLQYSCLENPMDGIPWTEKPGRLWSMESLEVGHNWVTSLSRIGEGNGNPLQCSCLENPRDRGTWWAAVYGISQSRTQLKRPSSRLEPGSAVEPNITSLIRTTPYS